MCSLDLSSSSWSALTVPPGPRVSGTAARRSADHSKLATGDLRGHSASSEGSSSKRLECRFKKLLRCT